MKTIEQKAKAYDDALERARALNNGEDIDVEAGTTTCEYIFPELKEPKENNDEKIRKELIAHFRNTRCVTEEGAEKIAQWVAWLEKQAEPNPYDGVSFKYNGHAWGMCAKDNGVEIIFDGELKAFLSLEKSFIYPIYHKPDIAPKSALEAIKEEKVDNQNCVNPVDNDEPKFHPGDWIIRSDERFKHNTYLIKEIKDYYVCEELKGRRVTFTFNDAHKNFKLWDISDAKRGDVVVDKSDGTIGIFQSIGHHPDGGSYNDHSYCFLYCRYDDGFFYADFEHGNTINSNDLIPATKEQRDLFFEKMTQAGWKWNAENKELSKQTLKITPKFCVGQLITDDNGTWYQITNIKCLDDWYYEVYDICEGDTHLELCSIIDEKFRENRFVSEIKKMIRD